MTNWTSAHRTRPRPRLDRATGLSWTGVGSRSRVHRLTTRYARRGQIVGRDQCREVRVGEHRFESNESYSDLHPNPPATLSSAHLTPSGAFSRVSMWGAHSPFTARRQGHWWTDRPPKGVVQPERRVGPDRR